MATTTSTRADNPPITLDQPCYGASFGTAFRRFWVKYFTFSGRASRSEFWWWALAQLLLTVVLAVLVIALYGGIDGAQGSTSEHAVSAAWGLVTAVPTLALNVRRLHDTNRRGWWLLLHLIPLVGSVVLIFWYLSESDPAGGRFDNNRDPHSPTHH